MYVRCFTTAHIYLLIFSYIYYLKEVTNIRLTNYESPYHYKSKKTHQLSEKSKVGEHMNELICRTPGIKVTFTHSHRCSPTS